jgi:hypothetical protein
VFPVAIALLGACALWKNSETEILGQLKACETNTSRTWSIGSAGQQRLFRVQRMLFQRLTVVMEEDRKRAHVAGTLDLDGSWVAQGASPHSEKEQYIRSLGFERIEFVYEEGRWKAERGCFPQLEAVLWFLSEEVAEKETRTLGWNIRVEREGVQISQAFEKTLHGEEGIPRWRSFSLRRGVDGKLRNVDAQVDAQ